MAWPVWVAVALLSTFHPAAPTADTAGRCAGAAGVARPAGATAHAAMVMTSRRTEARHFRTIMCPPEPERLLNSLPIRRMLAETHRFRCVSALSVCGGSAAEQGVAQQREVDPRRIGQAAEMRARVALEVGGRDRHLVDRMA